MAEGTLVFNADGLDAAAYAIIAPRERMIRTFLEPLLPLAHESSDPSALYQHALALDHGSYAPLAQQFGFNNAIRQRLLRRCWKHGMLSKHRWQPYDQAYKRSRVISILRDIDTVMLEVFAQSPHVTDWIRSLTQHQLCRDEQAAYRIAHEFDSIDEQAAKQARDLVLSWCQSGDIGLLKYADYPCYEELMLVQRSTEAAALRAVLRRDVIALYHAFQHPDFLKAYHAAYGPQATPWNQSLLTSARWHQRSH